MLQVKYILDNKEKVIEGLKKRNLDSDSLIQEIIELNIKRKDRISKVEILRAEGNKMSKAIGELFKKGKNEEANARSPPQKHDPARDRGSYAQKNKDPRTGKRATHRKIGKTREQGGARLPDDTQLAQAN